MLIQPCLGMAQASKRQAAIHQQQIYQAIDKLTDKEKTYQVYHLNKTLFKIRVLIDVKFKR